MPIVDLSDDMRPIGSATGESDVRECLRPRHPQGVFQFQPPGLSPTRSGPMFLSSHDAIPGLGHAIGPHAGAGPPFDRTLRHSHGGLAISLI
jgi:hypothetical protein